MLSVFGLGQWELILLVILSLVVLGVVGVVLLLVAAFTRPR